jgi:serine/threonine-protein kinase
VEAERRYSALHEARPRDVEILMRLATLRGQRDPAAASATFRALLELAPNMAGAEFAAGENAADADDLEAATQYYQGCLDASPMAVRCLSRLARLQATSGRCDAYARDVTRILVLADDDWSFQRDGLSAALTTGAAEDSVRAAIQGVLRTGPAVLQRFGRDLIEGEVALWRGAMPEARDAFVRADRIARGDGALTFPAITLQRLTIAEELGDEEDVRAIARAYLGARTLSGPDPQEGVVLSILARHRIFPKEEILRIRDRWREDVVGVAAPLVWLSYDASLAVTEAEAREALSSGLDARLAHAFPDVNAQVGHLLLLARRFADAASRLELVAFDCALFLGDDSYIPLVVRAAYDLGQAREGLGDVDGACVAYRRVLDRWGGAVPRSTTAQAARARSRALHCAN